MKRFNLYGLAFLLSMSLTMRAIAENNDSLLLIMKNISLHDSVRYGVSELLINQNVYSDPQLALKHADIFQLLAENEKRNDWLADVLWKKGIIYRELNDVKKAITSLFDALEMAEKNENELLKSKIYNSLGAVYTNQENYTDAEECFKKSLAICLKLDDKMSLADAYLNMGGINKIIGKYEAAVKFTNDALKIYLELEDKDGQAYVYSTLAGIFNSDDQNLDSAIFYHNKALQIFLEFDNTRSIIYEKNNLGVLYLKKNDLNTALSYCLDAYWLAKESNLVHTRQKSCECLFTIYEKKNDPVSAYPYLKEFHELKDSLFDIESINEISRREILYQYRESQLADSLLRVQEDTEKQIKHDKEVEQQKIYTYFGTGISAIALAFLIFVYRGLRHKKRANRILEEKNSLIKTQKSVVEHQKQIVEEKHKEISDSINYAERIQRSLMASKELLDENLADYFIYFNPKERVSGDFYWASKLQNGNFCLVAADSTGHGVPGAIMSMLNISSFEKAVEAEKISLPAEILNFTRKKIIETLAKDGSAEGGKDGMDCAFLCFDFNAGILDFALANNPLWLIRQSQLIEFKPDKMPVGKHDRQIVPFSQQQIKLTKGDLILIFTDGFTDQFGGKNGKKFKYKNLKELLLSMAADPMAVQKQKLNEAFEQWKGELEQVDDVCVIGVRI